MNRILLLILLALVGFQAHAQYEHLSLLHNNIKVIDEVTKKLLRGAEFTVFDTHGRQLENADFWERTSFRNEQEVFNGYTVMTDEFVDTLVIRATLPGHEVAEAIVPTPRSKYEEAKTKDGRFWWNDEIRLMTRRSMNIELGEAEVTASRILMVQKGDTIIYNAAALQMSSGSMLNNLVRALPGVQLSANGRITVNGEFVQSLLVNGKDFFKGDPNVALDNLPYYTVDKIKVYHRGLDDLKNATLADSLRAMAVEKALVMDVRLKKEYGEGWLANFEAASGFRTTGDQGAVHRGRAFALRFTDHSKLGIYASANNVGDNANATHNGEWREMNAAGYGENTMQNAGIDFSIENKEETRKFATTLTARHNDNNCETQSSTQNFYPTGDVFNRSRSLSSSNSANVSWNASYSQHKERRYNFSVSPNFYYSKSNGDSQSLSASFDGDPLDATRTASLDSIFPATVPSAFAEGSNRLLGLLIYSNQGMGRNESYNLNAGISASGSIRLPFTKQNLSLSAGTNYHENERNSFYFSHVNRRSSGGYDENSRNVSPSSTFRWNASISHRLFMLNRKRGWLQGDLSYSFNHDSSNDANRLYKSDLPLIEQMASAGALPSIQEAENGQWTFNLPNSYDTRETTDDHKLQLYLLSIVGRNVKTSRHFHLAMPLHILNRSIVDTRNGGTQRFNQQLVYFSTDFGFRCGNFDASYDLRPELTKLHQLIDVTDNSSSLYIFKTNPNLRTAFGHDIFLGYNFKRPEHSEWLNVNTQTYITQHKVMDAVTFDRNTGVTTTQPLNTEGNWWSTAGFSYGRAFDKAKHFNGELGLRYTFAHSVGFANDAASLLPEQLVTLNNRVRSNFRLGYSRNQMRVDLTGNFTWNDVNSDRANFQHLQYADHSYGLTFATPLFPGIGKDKWTIDFDTDVKLYLRRGYREPSMNTTEWVWNAALSTRVGKTKQWTLRAVGFDLLHQLSNITHSLTAQSFSETWTNTVRSYVSFHVVYHLQMKPKKGIE
ncbi:MAG: hypothetical protein Q4D23_06085 [Bacteroidales bacterium]|nr:hypothetical protein [Bacteroidales bacterium]